MAIARGIRAEAIVAGLARLAGVPGRLERVDAPPGILCVVDYSHTPDALERALAALRPLVATGRDSGLAGNGDGNGDRSSSSARPGRLIVVFGCGGDRDRGKRPLMGQLAARDADLAIVTSDNPRTEDPRSIIEMVVEGVRRESLPELDATQLAEATRGFHVEADRQTAIRRAVGATRPGDVLIIAGKGHEDYQIIGTTRRHFDDREEAGVAFRQHPLSAPVDAGVNKGR
jgi:UDP-N-acetylmuramoyl-L-alanyl-D-glutamate--2,6-diaminopimelate ligase